MIKQLSLAVIAVVMLSACGGGNDDWCCDATPAPSSASSDSSSSVPDTSMNMSFGFEENIDGWYINGSDPGTIVTVDMELAHDMTNSGMEFKPLDWTQHASSNWLYQARLDFEDAPLDLSDSRLSVTASIPQSYVDDGALVFQLIVHHTDSASTEYGGHLNLADLTANDDGNYVIERDIDVDSAIAMGIQIATPPSDLTIKDTILVKGVLITLPADSGSGGSSSSASGTNTIDIPMDSTWRGNSGGTTAYSAEGVEFTATASGQGAVYDYAGPVNWEGATLNFVINVSQVYKDSGAALQPFAQSKDASGAGHWGCWINNSDLIVGIDQTVTCGPLGADFNISDAAGLQAGIQAPASVNGSITIKSASVTLAE